MPTAVPAVDRASAVLRFLAGRPDEAIALSDVARETGVHKATCASILTVLTEQGLVTRDDRRRYSLGPELLRLGHAYTQRFPAFIAGRRELLKLSERLGLSC